MLIFFIVLICAVAIYYLISLRYRWIVLLVASVAFYLSYGCKRLAVRGVYSKTERFSGGRKNGKEKEQDGNAFNRIA
mgnify:CR=1 FL=1